MAILVFDNFSDFCFYFSECNRANSSFPSLVLGGVCCLNTGHLVTLGMVVRLFISSKPVALAITCVLWSHIYRILILFIVIVLNICAFFLHDILREVKTVWVRRRLHGHFGVFWFVLLRFFLVGVFFVVYFGLFGVLFWGGCFGFVFFGGFCGFFCCFSVWF